MLEWRDAPNTFSRVSGRVSTIQLSCTGTRAFPMCFEQQIAGETLVKSCQMSDSVWHRQASTRSSARKPGYLTFPVVELRVSVA